MTPPNSAFFDSDTVRLLDGIGAQGAPQLRALLVDDDPIQLQVTGIALRRAGFAVSAATTGSEALRLFAEHLFNVAVVDLGLPDSDGVDVIQWMRQALHGPTVRIVAWTSSTEEAVLERALQAGADDVYQKHLGPAVILAKFQRLAAEITNESSTASRLLRLEKVIESFAKSQEEMSEAIKGMRADIAPMREVVQDWMDAQAFKRSVRDFFGLLRRFWVWIAAFATAVVTVWSVIQLPKAPK
jgi:DNA-binding response OmpR family regulator